MILIVFVFSADTTFVNFAKEACVVSKNKFKQKFNAVPVEQFTNAPLSNIEKTKPVSQVTIPGEVNVRNAKEWVDSNEH